MSPNEAFKTFEGLALRLARQYVTVGVDLEDLEQEAHIAVQIAVPLWSEARATSLKTFVCHRIRNALKEYKRKNQTPDHMSFDAPAGKQDFDGEEMTMHDMIGTEAPNVGDGIDAKRVQASEAIQRTPVVVEIIRLRSGGLTFEEIGQRVGKTTHAVMMAWRRACKRLPNTSKTAA